MFVEIDHLAIRRLELPEPPREKEDILYVVLHGLVSIVETTNEFLLYLIDMEEDHRYLAGTWLGEKEVSRNTNSQLSGVDDGGEGVDPVSNPVIKLQQAPSRNHPKVFGVIRLPKPRKLYSLDRGEIKITAGFNNLLQPPATLSAVRVLEYRVTEGFGGVRMKPLQGDEGFAWVPEHHTTFHSGARIAALHIYDMPGGEVPVDHHVREFAISSEVLGAPIAIDKQIVPEDMKGVEVPPGLSPLELVPLDSRATDVSPQVLDFIRTLEWNPSGTVTETCRTCCGGADGRVMQL